MFTYVFHVFLLFLRADNHTGGGGGGGGGIVLVAAEIITGTGTIRANGGNGWTFSGSDSGGGGQGGGGCVIVISSNIANTITMQANAGTHGSAYNPGSDYGETNGNVFQIVP